MLPLRASRFISHTWSNTFVDTADAILNFFECREDRASTMIWMDVFVDCQHVVSGASKEPSWCVPAASSEYRGLPPCTFRRSR